MKGQLRLGSWLYTPSVGVLEQNSNRIRLPAKQSTLLNLLLENAGQVLSKEQLVAELWQGKIVNDDALARLVAELRNAFDDSASDPKYIETIPKRGYRLVCSVEKSNHKNVRWLAVGVAIIAISSLGYWLLNIDNYSTYPKIAQEVNQAHRITATSEIEFHPELSKDGSKIAFITFKQGRSKINMLNINTHAQSTIKSENENLLSPIWSPDQKRLALAVSANQKCLIKIYDLANELWQELAPCYFPNGSPILDWSPDGRYLAFVSSELSASGSSHIWIYDFETQQSYALTKIDEARQFDTRPRFSPDGQQLAFLRGTASVQNIFVVDINNAGLPTQKTFTNGQKSSFSWLDERSLIFDNNTRGDRNLWLLNLSTDELSNLGAKDAQSPTFALQSNTLVYKEVRYQANLWLHDLVDGASQQIVASAKYDNHPSIAPNNAKIAYSTNRFGFGQIWIYDKTTNTEEKLISIDGKHLLSPSWHASGTKLLFTAIGANDWACMQIDLAHQLKIERVSELELGNCVFHNDKVLGIEKSYLKRPALYQVDANGESTLLSESAINKVETTQSGKIIVSKENENGLYLFEDGRFTKLVDDYPFYLTDYWTVAGEFIYYVNRQKQGEIWKTSVTDGSSSKVTDRTPLAVGFVLSVSHDGKWMVSSQAGENTGNLFMTTVTK